MPDMSGRKEVNALTATLKNPEKYLSEKELAIRTVTEDWLDRYARQLCGTKQHNELVESILAQLKLIRE